MAKFRASEDEHYAPNVWPAVTDAILLMASIFIVLSVVSMISMANKLHDYDRQGEEGDKTMCYIVPISSDVLRFPTGKATLENPQKGREAIKTSLTKVAAGIEDIRNYAESEGWSEYYVILEVAGHTDNVPNPGTGLRDGNWKLASERANTVLDYIEGYLEKDQGLKKRFNINSGQAQPKSTILRSSGYSHHLPVTSLKNKTQNRRIELRLFAQPVEMLHLRTAIK